MKAAFENTDSGDTFQMARPAWKAWQSEFREVPAAAPTLPVASPANSGEPMVTSSAKRVVEEPCA